MKGQNVQNLPKANKAQTDEKKAFEIQKKWSVDTFDNQHMMQI